MKNLVFVCVLVFAFSTTAMAIDIAAQTDANWWGSAAAEREMKVIADSVPVSVELFSASQEGALADWLVAHTGNGAQDLLILTGSFPSSIYAGNNGEPDDSIAESFLDDGNTIINTGDWMFFVSRAGNNGSAGLRNMMDIPGVTMSGSNDTPVELTADGLKIIPSLPEFLTDRPFHLDTLDGDWFPELILAQDASGNLADPVVVKNSVTGGRIGIFMQVNGDNQNDRGVVISEWINNWYLQVVSDPAGAWRPNPADEADDIGRDADLSWRPGAFAATHNVYLGTSFDDVSAADPAALVGDGLGTTSLDVGRLDFDQTYFWRVDEVNGAPDFGVFNGKIWSFTTEPFSIPITNITATASNSFGASGPEKTIDGSGLVDDLHGVGAADMWISGAIPATIEYAFDRAYKLHELWIWNSNQAIEAFVGFGAKDVVIEHSLDGETWTVLEGVGPLAQATGTPDYAHNNTIDFGGATAQH
ncbi:MAG: hypothetical protein IIA65_05760, partial [Planctomycetes bacterium]|nr:hypothetical protein [Planctomycetota bacterium]